MILDSPGAGIIYTLTVRDAVRLTDWLKARGINVESYTGRSGDRRDELEHSLLVTGLPAYSPIVGR